MAGRQASKQAGSQVKRQTSKQTHQPTNRHTHTRINEQTNKPSKSKQSKAKKEKHKQCKDTNQLARKAGPRAYGQARKEANQRLSQRTNHTRQHLHKVQAAVIQHDLRRHIWQAGVDGRIRQEAESHLGRSALKSRFDLLHMNVRVFVDECGEDIKWKKGQDYLAGREEEMRA